MGADGKGLAEGEPDLGREAALGDGAPENENIDASIAAAGRGIALYWQRRANRARSAPWLHPGQAHLFKLGDDFVDDFLVQAVSVREGFVGRCRMGPRMGVWLATQPRSCERS